MADDGTGPRGAVVITGASTGIGEACALRLDGMGFRVFAGVRKDADGEALRAKSSPRLTPVRMDVTEQATIDAAKERIAGAVGGAGLAGLVNNAGIAVAGVVEFLALDEWRRQFEVNVIGQVAVTQALMPLLRAGRGRIVNIGSVSGRLASPFLGPYSASKFAMEAVTDALRFELRPWKIGVSIVEPGSIATPIWEKGEEMADRIERELPDEGRERYGDAIAAMRVFAATTANRAIPADRVARAVVHALTSKRPKTRYLVGTDARLQAAMASMMPDRVVDRLIEMQLGLGKQKRADEAEVG